MIAIMRYKSQHKLPKRKLGRDGSGGLLERKSEKNDEGMEEMSKEINKSGMYVEEKWQLSLKAVFVVVMALIVGIGAGVIYYYFFIPRPNPATRVPATFAINASGFERVDLGVSRFPELEEQKEFVGRSIYEWIIEQKDSRGMFVPATSCVFDLKTYRYSCASQSDNDPTFFSNRSFQAPLWGMLRYYQNTGDRRALTQIERDLRVVRDVILDGSVVLQNNDYSCLFMKDLYFSTALTEGARQIARDICAVGQYEFFIDPVSGVDYMADIREKITWLLNDEFTDERVSAEMARNGIVDMNEHLRISNDFRTVGDGLVALIVEPRAGHGDKILAQMDFLLTQYAWMRNMEGRIPDFYNSGMVLALVYFSQFHGLGNDSGAMQLARQIYNTSVTRRAMSVDDMLDIALVQHHLGFAMSQIQSALLEIFYDEEFNSFGGIVPRFFQTPGSGVISENMVSVSGDIRLNGLLLGVLSI